jgi:mannose-6-phosphate isomerase
MKEVAQLIQEPIFLIPVFKERIWGGTKLRDAYGYKIPSDMTGECWAISGHPHGQSVVRDGEFKGCLLGDLWRDHPELFGRLGGNLKGKLNVQSNSKSNDQSSDNSSRAASEVFPLLTKILDAGADLSVQVHPDDAYAMQYENGEHGKTECWYIIDCDDGAEIVYGHTARQKNDFKQMVEVGNWDRLLRKVPIHKGDFVYVPSGTIHALRAGTLVLETQQNSDTTYRVYDYDRKDAQGKRRELHIQKAIEVTNIPHVDFENTAKKHQTGDLLITTFIESEFFSVYEWVLDGEANCTLDLDFLLVSVLDGSGEIITDSRTFGYHKGDHLILPHGMTSFKLHGKSQWIVSGVKAK